MPCSRPGFPQNGGRMQCDIFAMRTTSRRLTVVQLGLEGLTNIGKDQFYRLAAECFSDLSLTMRNNW